MAKKKKELNLDERIDSIIELLEDLRYEQSKKKECENCEDDDYTNINDEDEENK